MKTTKWIMCMALGTGLHLASCTSMDEGLNAPSETKQGELTLKLSSGTEFKDDTRALSESSYANVNNYKVQVFDKDNVMKLECLGSELESKMPLTLNIGSFKVKAFYGQESSVSRDHFYVEGTSVGTIKADDEVQISVTCTPTCGKVKVEFADGMNTFFKDYKVIFSGTAALGMTTATWEKADTEPLYFLLNENGEDINFTISATAKDEFVNVPNKEQTFEKKGKFKLSRNKGYKMKVESVYSPGESGTPSFSITIDEVLNEYPEDIEVPITWI